MARTSVKILVALLTASALPSFARALSPDDIAVIFNTNSPNSLRVARYYMMARKIPASHLIPITCNPDALTEEQYRTMLAPQVLKGLADRKLVGTDNGTDITCLVTTYDVPLRIFAHQPTAAERQEVADLQKQLDDVISALEKQTPAYAQIARVGPPEAVADIDSPSTKPAATAPAPNAVKKTWRSAVEPLNAAASAAAMRLDRLPEPARGEALKQFLEIHERVAGIGGVLNALRLPPDASDASAAQQRLNQFATQLQADDEQYQALARQPTTPRIRKEMVAAAMKGHGLVGAAQSLENAIALVQPPETESCLDNELALVLADQSYTRAKWFPNPENLEIYPTTQHPPTPMPRGTQAAQTKPPRTLMVCRLDGSTPDKTIEMIDTTLKVEAAGLEGKFYIDARGLRGTDGYALFDAELRRTADWMKQHATIDTVLEDTPALLQAKDAPNAAVYCGWYSLDNYQESGQWVKGAVGYHVASYEMGSLHNPKETGWVVNLLNRGFCGTLGATDEPYLDAFPKPSLFFPLLLSGQFTQGEVWQVTAPNLSWRIGFVGDPLYNPFKIKPRVKVEDLKSHPVLRNAFEILKR